MRAREQFVHFVGLFAPEEQRLDLVEEAYRLPIDLLVQAHIDDHGDRVEPVLTRPMDGAWEYVQHRRYGTPRPVWLPRILPPSPVLL